MANIDKVRIPSAITRRTKLDLSNDHITTLQFGMVQPVMYRHMLKDESIDIKALATVRPFPITVPTFGRMRLNIRAFFVPYSQVFPQWNEFYSDTIGNNQSYSSLVSEPPFIRNSSFIRLFVGNTDPNPVMCEVVPDAGPGEAQLPFDFVVGNVKYKFGFFGRIVIKRLHSLGYRFSWELKDETRYNALGLLSYVKIWVDWYCNQNYLNSGDCLYLKRLFEWRDPRISKEITREDLYLIFTYSHFVCYDNDPYFNAAWDNPSSPVNGQSSLFSFEDVTMHEDHRTVRVQTSTLNGTPYMTQGNASDRQIGTQYIHDVLKALTDYQQRHKLASALPVSRWLAQWGSTVPSLANSRSIYIGAQSIDIDVGDIMSTASTESADLGDYAGRSFGQGNGAWSFTSQEFGCLVILASVLPVGSLYQGCDRNNLSMEKTEFYQPEFDGLSTQAISRREVLTPMTSPVGDPVNLNKAFGWTGRYGHYKRPLNFVTGDFAIPSAMIGGSSWHLNRVMESFMQTNVDIANLAHSESFTRMEDSQVYNRIFNSTSMLEDKFFGCFHFDVASYVAARPLFDTYEFEDVGKSVTLDNGSFVN